MKTQLSTLATLATLGLTLSGAATATTSALPLTTPATQEICQILAARAQSHTALSPRPSHLDNRLVVFPFHEHGLYTLHLHFNTGHTHLEFSADEQIVASYVNDETLFEQSVVDRTMRDVFVRALVKGAVGTITVITNKRRYQLEMFEVSDCTALSRYQRVSWSYGQRGWQAQEHGQPHAPGGQGPQAGLTGLTGAAQTAAQPASNPSSATGGGDAGLVDVSKLNMDYRIEGDDAIKPVRVFDDGRRTFVQFSRDVAFRPAIFQVNSEGRGEPVDYIPEPTQFVLPRVFEHGLLLKLGKQEVRIRNMATSSCGLFDSQCRRVQVRNVSSTPGEVYGH